MGQKKHFLKIAAFGILASGLVVGASGALFVQTSAQSSLWWLLGGDRGNSRWDRNDRNDRNNEREDRTEETVVGNNNTQQQTPVEPAPVEQAPAEAPAPQPVQAQPAAPVVQAAPVEEVVAPAPPVDTAPQIATMAAAQATPQSQQISYTSSRISDTTRNQILIAAATAAVVGGILYTLGIIGGSTPTRRSIPVRYVVPIKESISVREG